MTWTRLIAAADLPAGEVVAVEVADPDDRPPEFPPRFAVWRTRSGRFVACDARCPHQWSDLATEGRVEGEELVCQAHRWRFDAEGRGSKLSALGRRDPKADAACLPLRVVDGWVEAELLP